MFARNNRMRRTISISLLALAAVSLMAASASAAVAPTFQTTVAPASYLPLVMKPRMGQIAFTSDRDGKDEIYLMNANGSEQINLTNNSATDRDPRWSPDGSRLLFLSNRDDPTRGQIYVMDADGSNQTRLTDEPGGILDPAWSPDGAAIAYSIVHEGHGDIAMINIDGSNRVVLMHETGFPRQLAWSPDGKKLAFLSQGLSLFTVNRDGTGRTQVKGGVNMFDQPWFPDSTRLAFSTLLERPNCGSYPLIEIFVANADGSDQKRLTYTSAPCEAQAVKGGAAVSPDGARIKFEMGDIYVLRADGSGLTNVTNTSQGNAWADWSPDGTMLSFFSSRDGSSDIYIVNADGSNLFRLTSDPAAEYNPVWRP